MNNQSFENRYATGEHIDLKTFSDNIRFADWQLKILEDVPQNITFKYLCFADDGMPSFKETNIYEIFSDGNKIGECYDRCHGTYAINPTSLIISNNPGYPAFFYYTITPFRSEHDAMIRSTTHNDIYFQKDYDWSDCITDAWYPTFDSLYDLLEYHIGEK